MSIDIGKSETSSTIQAAAVMRQAMDLICLPGHVYELRVPAAGKYRVISGYYSDLGQLLSDAQELDGFSYVNAVYLTINPVNPDLIARAANRYKQYAKNTTSDLDIVRRLRLMIDFDPVRPAGISSTAEEHQMAIDAARRCHDWLRDLGAPECLLGDSGNGGHIVGAVDLPNDADSCKLITQFLAGIKSRYGNAKLEIDQTVFNASRISKLYGSMTRKGDNIPERPWRRSGIISAPAALAAIPVELLQEIAKPVPVTAVVPAQVEPKQPAKDASESDQLAAVAWMRAFFDKHNIKTLPEKNPGKYLAKFVLEECTFCHERDKSAVITISKAGKYGFTCQHNRCKGPPKKSWKDFRRLFEPEQVEAEDTLFLDVVKDHCQLWHDHNRRTYATLPSGAHLAIAGAAFASWIRSMYLDVEGKGLTESKANEILATLAAIAECKGPCHRTYRRVARLDNRIEIDLGDTTYDAVIINANGWTVGKPTARFIRSDNSAALPRPVPGGSIDDLRPFVNVSADKFPLVVGSILDALKGHGPYFVTALTGEQASGKSTMLRVTRRLIDPVRLAELSSCPRNEQDLAIDAENNYFLATDNVSKLQDWLSDALCRVSTGGGFKTRKLYTDADQQIIDVCRPVALNGIEDFVVAGDLISRSVIVKPEVMTTRRTESEFWAAFNMAASGILGALYTAVAQGLAGLDEVELEELPRMADSARWIAACCPALGWTYDDWHEPYERALGIAARATLDNSIVALALREFVANDLRGKSWTGTATALHEAIRRYCPEGREKDWPKIPRGTTNALNRLANDLRTFDGIDFVRHEGKAKYVGQSTQLFTVGCSSVAHGCSSVAHVKNDMSNHETPKNTAFRDAVAHVAHTFPLIRSQEKEEEQQQATAVIQGEREMDDNMSNMSNSATECPKKQAFAVAHMENQYEQPMSNRKGHEQPAANPWSVDPAETERVLAMLERQRGKDEADLYRAMNMTPMLRNAIIQVCSWRA